MSDKSRLFPQVVVQFSAGMHLCQLVAAKCYWGYFVWAGDCLSGLSTMNTDISQFSQHVTTLDTCIARGPGVALVPVSLTIVTVSIIFLA